MVRFHQRYRLLRLLLVLQLLAAVQLAHGGDYGLKVENPQLEYGKPMFVELSTPAHDANDLRTYLQQQWQADFALAEVEKLGLKQQQQKQMPQHWRITLYPRQPGKQRLPPLVLPHWRSSPQSIVVSAAKDLKDGTPLTVTLPKPELVIWQRQSVEIKMEIESDKRVLFFEYDTVTMPAPITLTPLNAEVQTLTSAKTQRYRHIVGWRLDVQKAGDYRLELPAIRVVRDGIRSHRFYSPFMAITVKALPSYIPSTLPVGEMQLRIDSASTFIRPNRLSHFDIQLQAQNSSAIEQERLWQNLLSQLRSLPSRRLYPSQVLDEEITAEQPAVEYADKRSISFHYRLPFVHTETVLLRPAPLRLQYFSPQSGKIISESVSLPWVISLPGWLYASLIALLLLIIVYLSQSLFKALRRGQRRYQRYRQAYHYINDARALSEAREALRLIAQSIDWPANLSLLQWRARWLQRFGASTTIDSLLPSLQQELYACHKPNTPLSPQQLHMINNRAHPLFAFLFKLTSTRQARGSHD